METLKEMFAGVGEDTLQEVLRANGGDVQRAAEFLLSASAQPAAAAPNTATKTAMPRWSCFMCDADNDPDDVQCHACDAYRVGRKASAQPSTTTPTLSVASVPATATNVKPVSPKPEPPKIATSFSYSTTGFSSRSSLPTESLASRLRAAEKEVKMTDRLYSIKEISSRLCAQRILQRRPSSEPSMKEQMTLHRFPPGLLLHLWMAVVDAAGDDYFMAEGFTNAFLRWMLPFCKKDIDTTRAIVDSLEIAPIKKHVSDSMLDRMIPPLTGLPILRWRMNGYPRISYPQLNIPTLEHVSFRDCAALSDVAVQYLLQKCIALLVLDLRLTSPSIVSRTLRILKMEDCKGLLFVTIRDSPNLEEVVTPPQCQLDWKKPPELASIERILASSDFYDVLGVTRQATDQEIARNYKQLALKLHPDKNPDPRSEQAFKMVGEAFAVLSDHDKRAAYDEERMAYIAQHTSEVVTDLRAYILSQLFSSLASISKPTPDESD